MNITCKNIQNFPYCSRLKLIAGSEGLNHVIEWVHYLEEPVYVEWLKGGELIITTGIMIGKDEKQFLALVEGLYERNVAGLVVNKGIHIKRVPDSVIRLADRLALPVFEMPLEIRIEDLSQSICSRIVQRNNTVGDLNKILLDLIYGKRITQKRIQKLMDYNYKPGGSYCSVVFVCAEQDVERQLPPTQVGNIRLFEEDDEEEFLNRAARRIDNYMESRDRRVLYVVDNGAIIMMLPVKKKGDAAGLIRTMFPWLKDRVDIKAIRAGIGYQWTDLSDFKDSVDCAQHAIFFGEKMNGSEEVFDYSDLTTIRIFDEIEDKKILQSIERQVLGKIVSDKDEAELLRTLEMYLRTECNAKETAAALFIHENTMRYRLRKIENLLNKDLHRHDDIFELELAMQIREYLEYMQYDSQGGYI